MAESSDLYDPNLAGNTVLGENYVNMLAKLKQDNIDTSAFDKNSVYQYLSDDNKINYEEVIDSNPSKRILQRRFC